MYTKLTLLFLLIRSLADKWEQSEGGDSQAEMCVHVWSPMVQQGMCIVEPGRHGVSVIRDLWLRGGGQLLSLLEVKPPSCSCAAVCSATLNTAFIGMRKFPQ
jgi:hypothetical protein